jgi:phosphate transport system permease protein
MYKIQHMTLLENKSADIPAPREITTKPRFSDRVFRTIVTSVGALSVTILTLIGLFLALRGFATFREEGLSFITGFEWQQYTDDAGNRVSNLGIGAMLIGTILVAVVALIVAVPLSVFCALYLTFYAPTKVKNGLVTLIDLMASFPSILFGMWGYFVLMPSAEYWAKLLNKYLGWIPVFDVQAPLFTRSPFIAGLVLATMIIPIVTSVSREVFSQTPLDRIQAAYALGANKWSVIKTVVLPFGANGVVGGSMLGLGRALGETVAVFTVLNIVYAPNFQVLFGSGGNVASHIIAYWSDATEYETGALLGAGFVLFLMTLLVNFSADFIVNRAVTKGK